MAKINLRPWREELRAEKQKQFIVMVVGAAIIAGGLAFLSTAVLRINNQEMPTSNLLRKNWTNKYAKSTTSSANATNCWPV